MILLNLCNGLNFMTNKKLINYLVIFLNTCLSNNMNQDNSFNDVDVMDPKYLELFNLREYPYLDDLISGREKVKILREYYYEFKNKEKILKQENNNPLAKMVVNYYKKKAFYELANCSKKFHKKSTNKIKNLMDDISKNPDAFNPSDPKFALIFGINYPKFETVQTNREKYNILKKYCEELVYKQSKINQKRENLFEKIKKTQEKDNIYIALNNKYMETIIHIAVLDYYKEKAFEDLKEYSNIIEVEKIHINDIKEVKNITIEI
ncbi:hypothetical protein QJ854_gp877 [Moumouvirus goulette]|uniref:Uncharacterized protein n=1 Tax=Moumouvirus goulette TaxID=1247379 RepID=M1NLP1_9VIRU|nr:hypothetical protein QJ854_gp877 [Moumouvirus goulette]AGF84905.1 hypothetical protein glt_00096 [Moumouvirus goulette]